MENSKPQEATNQEKTVIIDKIDFSVHTQDAQLIIATLREALPMSKAEGLVNLLKQQMNEQVQKAAIEQGVIPDPNKKETV